MSKILNNCIVENCGSCEYFESTLDIYREAYIHKCSLSRKELCGVYEIHPDCPLKDCEVLTEGYVFDKINSMRENGHAVEQVILVVKKGSDI